MTLVLTAFALGLAGLDPAGALLVAGALAAGAREGHVALFGLVVLVGTVVLGTTLSLTVGPRIAEIDWSVFAPGDRSVAFVETLLGVGLVCWGVVRARRPTAHAPKPRSAGGTGPIALVGAGLLFALSAVFDPTFVALMVIAGRDGAFWSAAVPPSAGRSSCWTPGGGSSPENCWYRTDRGNVGDPRFGPRSAGGVCRAFPELG